MYVQACFDVTWVRSKNSKNSSSSSSSSRSRSSSSSSSRNDDSSSSNRVNCVGGIDDVGSDVGVGEETEQRQHLHRRKIRGSAVVHIQGSKRTDWR